MRAALLDLWDRHAAAARSGDIEAAVALRSASVRAALANRLRAESSRAFLLAETRRVVPDALAVESLRADRDGATATLHAIASWTGGALRREIAVGFVREDAAWRIGRIELGADPAQVRRSADRAREPDDRFDAGRTVSIGGRIAATADAPDHTLLMIRLLDEEHLVYLPPRAALAGLDPATIEPGAVVSVADAPHRTNPDKLRAETIRAADGHR